MIDEPRPMKEIHKIQEELYEERKSLTDEEILKDFHRSAEELTRKYKLKLKPLSKQKIAV